MPISVEEIQTPPSYPNKSIDQLPAAEIISLWKTFGDLQALKEINVSFQSGEMVGLIGTSGSGKSTLLRHISGLIASDARPECQIKVWGQVVQSGGQICSDVRKIRAEIGFIFQQFNLVERMSLLKNVLVGRLAKIPGYRSLFHLFTQSEKMEAMQALDRVGLASHATQRASTLSGGQRQRAAIARTLQQQAKIILADEPIASLDPESARLVMKTLGELSQQDGITIVVSLHQISFAIRFCPRIVALKSGEIVFDGPSEDLSVEQLSWIYDSGSEDDFEAIRPKLEKW